MSFIAGVLTFLVVVNCVLLIFLVLIQLPKKDAGAGLAFGGGAADALFGAGSGNVLTKITKWATGVFFALALLLGLMEANMNRGSTSEFEKQLLNQQSRSATQPPATPLGASPTTTAPAATNAPGLLPLPANASPAPVASGGSNTPAK
jgi:preprotein translocase subunit SecG